jgi:hypothetical protein
VTSNIVVTGGAQSNGIEVQALGGNATVTSGTVTTTGNASAGIYAYSDDANVTVTSTGTIRTSGNGSPGIYAAGADEVRITSATIVTTGNNSAGIVATQFDSPLPPAPSLLLPVSESVLGPNGGIAISSGSITTSGTNSFGIDAFALTGNIEITSTGTISTSGAGSTGVLANALASSVLVDVNNIGVTGAGAATNAITVNSGTTSTIIIRGLVQSTNGFEVQANGGAATVSTTATGIIRGAVDLTDNADTLNNAGTFDAIGTSLFGLGADVFNNSGTTRSTNGAAVFTGLDSYVNAATGRIEMRDGATGDSLNVVGAYNGITGSRLGVDANLATHLADVLITGASTGSTILDVNLIGASVFDTVGTLVVDATAGTSATAFTLAGGVQSNPFVSLTLFFDAPNNNFLLLSNPDQPVFESLAQAEMITNFWYESADAISAQLEAARDGLVPAGGTSVGNLAGGGRFGGWVQVLAGKVERDATQAFAGAGGTTAFNTSYDQDFQGIQGGLDYQSGGTILGVSFGVGKSDAEFEQSLNDVSLDGYNFAAYAAFNSGAFFMNAIAKVDWVDVDAMPGAGALTEFDATAWGVRGTAGFRFDMRNVYFEPSVSLSWVNVNIDDYTTNGATVVFDDITSLRGAAGVRFGGNFQSGNGVFSPFVAGYVVEEFDGDLRSNFTLGTTLGLQQDAPGTFGELQAGLNYSTGRLEIFARGEYDIGSDRDGLAGRAGVRLRF